MTHKEIKEKKNELNAILAKEDAGTRLRELQQLAKKVGASVTRTERHDMDSLHSSVGNAISESEIVHNIQVTLQTETMINMCKTAARNFWITLVAMLIAVLAMLATWAKMGVNWWHGC